MSPYLHLAPDGLAPPMFVLDSAANAGLCAAVIDFGGTDYCTAESPPADVGCPQAVVTYELLGIDASGVLVQAFPVETGEVEGVAVARRHPRGRRAGRRAGRSAVGCLASGLTYTIALDAVGDDQGILASTQVTVP